MARRGENIYKRKDGRWEGRYIKGRDSTGKAIYGYIYSKTYSELKEKLMRAKNTSSNDIFNDIQQTISVYSHKWLEGVLYNHKKSTYVKYKNMVDIHIIPYFGKMKISDITTEYVKNFCLSKQQDYKMSQKSISDILSVLKLIFKFSGENNSVNFNDIPIKINKNYTKFLTKRQVKVLTKFLICNINYVNIGILFSLYTGIRVGELCALKFNDIFIEEKILYVNKTMQRLQNFNEDKRKTDVVISSPKSFYAIREIPIPSFLIELIKKNKLYKEDAYLLTGDINKFIEPRTLVNKFKKVIDQCGIENVNFHILRHTFATFCIEAGVDVKSLSEILGHSNVNITLNRYVHTSIENKRTNIEKMYEYSHS